MNLPRITCVCVSKNRPAFLERAIKLFKTQTYSNKELVIVCEDPNASWSPVVSDEKIKFIRLPNGSELTLGERRNLSIQHCSGEYFCQWDDDDWYHNRRLEFQMNALTESGMPACVLNRVILFDGERHAAYLSSERYWEGTLLCSIYLITESTRYPSLNKSEDNSLVVSLVQRDKVKAMSAPYLYAYYYHGKNTWDHSHFEQLFQAGYPLDQNANKILHDIFVSEKFTDASEKMERVNLDVLGN